MRALEEQDHYDILEVSRRANPADIERAYHIACATYTGESLALYSIYGELDAAAIRRRVDEAYRTLSDPEARRVYDASLGDMIADAPGDALLVEQVRAEIDGSGSLAGEAFADVAAEVEEGDGDFDGPKLRRARLRRGIELDEISEITKVSPTNLRNIEEGNYADLPATVYVRGFVVAYARTLGLDAQRVAASYVASVECARSNQGRGGFLGRR